MASTVSFMDRSFTKPGARFEDEVRAAMRLARSRASVALMELEESTGDVAKAAHLLVGCLSTGHKVLAAGNGGSAAESQHFVAELVGRFKQDREPMAVISLTADTAVLTAVANDYGYSTVFERQINALAQPGDVVILFSTSGVSSNVVAAVEAAHERGCAVIAVTGPHQSPLACTSDVTILTPGEDSAAIQELHMILTHLLCGIVEQEISGSWSSPS